MMVYVVIAAGASDAPGRAGESLVIAGALWATSSAISATVFGSSRQMAEIARDGLMLSVLARRVNRIPVIAILTMSGVAALLMLDCTLRLILEFGSITFLLVSRLTATVNFRIRQDTKATLGLPAW